MMKNHKIQIALLIALFALAQPLWAQPAFVNGSLTGIPQNGGVPVQNGGVPAGWQTVSGNPDTNDVTHPAGVDPSVITFGVAPSGPSPDGGTWVGIAGVPVNFIEGFGQLVAGFVVGQLYALSWYDANFGLGSDVTASGKVTVSVNGTTVGTGSELFLGPNWFSESLSFVAPATSLQINFFNPKTSVINYLAVDGISVRAAQSANVPEGGSIAAMLGFCFSALLALKSFSTRARR